MRKPRAQSGTQPKFPYTTSPVALRKLLKEIPQRPKPGKLSLSIMKTWGTTGSNDVTPLRVLKNLGLLGSNGEPLDGYVEFMKSPPAGPRSLGARIKEQYKSLFESSHEPHKDTAELRKFFNIHSGGAEKTIDLQIQTFKALCEHADFTGSSSDGKPGGAGASDADADASKGKNGGPGLPPIKIDLHIHLPENKTTRDYEAIIQDIAKYIYGRKEVGNG